MKGSEFQGQKSMRKLKASLNKLGGEYLVKSGPGKVALRMHI